MAEYLEKLRELRSLPPELHLFCDAYDSPTTSTQGHVRVKSEYPLGKNVELRRGHVSKCMELFGYDGDDVVNLQEELGALIDAQLIKCDLCVIEYYKSRQRLIENLRNEYEEEEVAGMVEILNTRDIKRITRGLDEATQKLRATKDPGHHGAVQDMSAKMALFEALCCEAFLVDASLLDKHFREPFQLAQTKKRLKTLHCVPAAAIFLFDNDHDRLTWATFIWSKYATIASEEDFNFALREPLLRTMQAMQIMQTGLEVVPNWDLSPRFWHGIGLIINKLDSNLITHSLRALDIDIFRLALDYLHYDTQGFRPLIQVIQTFLELAPVIFWDAMGAISPTALIEKIFNNPQYVKIMEEAKEDENYDSSALKDMLSWIGPFMASLNTDRQAGVCRALGFQLLSKPQAKRFPPFARLECKRIGLATLAWTLANCNKDDIIFTHTGRIVAAETLKVVSDYIKEIISIPSLPESDKARISCGDACLKIIKAALALECKSLRTDQEALKQNKDLSNGFTSYSPAIWDAVVQHLDRANVVVARAALVGINDLTGLEKFMINADDASSKERSGFNVKYDRLTDLICKILERINDFNPTDLDRLFRYPDTATALIASLVSPDANVYEAGVNLIKSLSGESARREAIGYLVNTFLETTLNATSWAIRRITRNRTYAACPRMLKTSADVLDILCDSQSGLLRTHTLSGIAEIKAVENFWEHQWEGLRVIYETTEEWGRARVADSEILKEFCRDTMQLSERFFDQYSVFANAIESAAPIKQEEGVPKNQGTSVGKDLLEHPAKIMDAMLKWLRLRDLFLVDISVKLAKKVLNRLTEQGMTVAEGPRKILEQVLTTGMRTHLRPQEKAELARALEDNLGHPIAIAEAEQEQSDTLSDRSRKRSQPIQKRLKATTIDLNTWRSKAKPSFQATISDDEFGDSDTPGVELVNIGRSAELMKQKPSSTVAALSKGKPMQTRDQKPSSLPMRDQKPIKSGKVGIQSDADRVLFREKREKEREDKKRRDAETLALVKKKASIGIAGQTLGEGSGIGSIGVKGKDHAPKVSSMMVSSGTDTDDDDDLDHELFGGAPKPAKLPSAMSDPSLNRIMPTKARGPIKKARQARSAKDMRARLAPDLTTLHKTILSWDFFHNGDFPPGSRRNDYSLVSSTFRTPTDYQNVFEPLLILEAWQGFLKSKEEGNFKTFEINVANRMTVDAFLEVSTTMPMAEGKALGISEADIVLMSKAQSPASDVQQPHCLARVYKVSRKKTTMEITYKANVGNSLVASMVPNAVLYAVKVSSITPLEREYGALMGLKYFDLCDEVTKARPSPLLEYSEKQLGPLVANYNINIAQAKAVRSAVDNDAFTLIQGPPGSGKTKTIVAIVGALLTGGFGHKGVPINRPHLSTGGAQRTGTGAAAKKLLVCAPSNAAVDELVMRFKDGIKTVDGSYQKLSVVRIGRSEAINTNVLDVTLEELVNAKLNLATGKKNSAGDDVHKIMMAHKATSEEVVALRTMVDELRAKSQQVSPEQDREFEVLKRRKQQLSNQIDAARDSGDIAARDAEMNRRRVQQEVLDGAHVICATLSGSGHEMFQSLNIEFETVIIDEAAQSIELSALIPLKYGCSKCILVGDPKQLPPTVLSREAARFQYEQSLFVRMQANHPDDVHLLDTQYRMHPEISVFPSNAFYDARLLDGPGMTDLRSRPWHQSSILAPYRFFDVQGTHQSAPRGHSLINIGEIEVALKLFDRLITDCKGYDFNGNVGIITPYKSQLQELRSRFAQRYGESVFNTVEFNTTDAFQGRESEIIIFSCVRASYSKGIGFLSDIRRMNVGITRAKCSLWVLGNSQSLMQGEFWCRLIQDAKTRNRYTNGDLHGLLSKPLLSLGSQVGPQIASLNKVPSRRSTPSASTPSNNDPDIDMPDAPVLGGSTATSRRSSDVMEPSTNTRTYNNDQPALFQRAGGVNGLNDKRTCHLCGSFAHLTHNCDRTDASRVGGGCYRCGDVRHDKLACTAERCLACGAFGHVEKTCTSNNRLQNKDRDRLSRAEASHKHSLRHASEIRRRKQLGEHDPKVPIVRSTTNSPTLDHKTIPASGIAEHTSEKRKRGQSPPTGPSKSHKSYRPNPQDSRQAPQENRPLNQRANGGLGPHPNGRPAQNMPASALMNSNSCFSTPNNLAANAHARNSTNSLDNFPASRLPSTAEKLPPGPGNMPSNPSMSVATPKYTVPPPRKKKEVDPFIRPKRRP